MNKRQLFAGVLSASLLVSALPGLALAQDETTSDDSAMPEDTEWALASLAGETVPAEVETTLLLSGGEAVGNAGCNSYFGGYELDGEMLGFPTPFGLTQKFCEGPAQEVEDAYLPLLQETATWSIDDEGALSLADADGTVQLVFGEALVDVTATDVDPCADSGVELSWVAAPAWGSSETGSYSVYRDVAPGFTPSLTNLIASGVAATTWIDAMAPGDTPVYYMVRAENHETCSNGPSNNGVIETNLVEVSAVNATGGPGSGSVGDTLGASRSGTDVRLTWTDIVGATQYTVERSSAADTGFVVVGQPATAVYDDSGTLFDGSTWFYRVTNANACGN